jgi:hypothetical protein
MRNEIRWTIYHDSAFRDVKPVYEGDLSIVQGKEGGEVFFRPRLSGEITFVRGDFDYLLANVAMSDKVEVYLEEFTGTWDALFSGFFYRSDAAIDEDNRTWTVTPQPLDRYDKVMAAMDREFDLVRLDVPRTPVRFIQQPVIQVYLLGASYLTNYIGSTHWEQPLAIDPPGQFDLEYTYFFAASLWFYIPGDDSVLDPDISGLYPSDGSTGPFFRTDNVYAIRLNPLVSSPDIQWEVYEVASGTVVYRKALNIALHFPSSAFTPLPPGGEFISLTTSDECQCFSLNVWARILTHEATVDGDPTDALPTSDIVEEGYNYDRVLPFEAVSIIGSSLHQADAGRWGKFADDALHFDGEYFVKPSASLGTLYPLNRSDWTEYSAWVYISNDLQQLLTDGGTERIIRDAYRVSDVLKYLLAEIDPLVFHEDAAAYSDFFYSGDNDIRTIRTRLALTPKSNVLKGDYDKPASRAPIKLGELLALLKNAYRTYWHIDANGKMILEHIHYYENGMHYTTPNVGADMTALLEPKTGKAWGWRGKRYKYEKEAMPEGFRFAWMDQVSFPFSGYSLDMLSAFVQRGQFEDVNMGPFTSDLAYALVQPASISPDGFFLFDADDEGTQLFAGHVEVTVSDEEEYYLQNGYASMLYLHDTYHRWALPAPDIRLNGNEDTAETVRRAKIQEEDFPAPDGLDPMELITTTIGTGEIRETSLNISSRSLKMTIAHDTE